jgi:hypothetical protein
VDDILEKTAPTQFDQLAIAWTADAEQKIVGRIAQVDNSYVDCVIAPCWYRPVVNFLQIMAISK